MNNCLGKLREFFKNNIAGVCVVAIFAALTIYNIINHIPWYDEVNAYNISQNLSVWEIFKLSRYEGHPMLWFLFLKPLTLLNVFFPYNLLIPNFLLILASLVILWKYSPFNNLEKTLITLSAPMFFYALVARCYSLSVLFLFAICSLYNKRHEHPYWYSVLLVLLANTSVMALYGAFVLGLLFLHDMYTFRKQNILTRKNIVVMVTFFVVSGIFILAQLVNPHPMIPVHVMDLNLLKNFLNIIFFDTNFIFRISNHLFILLLVLLPFMSLKKSLKPVLFVYCTTVMLIISFTMIYPPASWHFNFFYLYLIAAFWIIKTRYTNFEYYQDWIVWIFAVFLFLNVFAQKWAISGYKYPVVKYIKGINEIAKNKTIYVYPTNSDLSKEYPYFTKWEVKIYDTASYSVKDYEHFKKQWYYSFDINPVIFNNTGAYIIVDKKSNYKFRKEIIRRNAADRVKLVDNDPYSYIYQITQDD